MVAEFSYLFNKVGFYLMLMSWGQGERYGSVIVHALDKLAMTLILGREEIALTGSTILFCKI